MKNGYTYEYILRMKTDAEKAIWDYLKKSAEREGRTIKGQIIQAIKTLKENKGEMF